MATTLQIDSFNDINIRERSVLTAATLVGAAELPIESTEGYTEGDVIYIGSLSREGCEKAVVASVDDGTTLTVSAGLELAHAAYEPVTSVLGDSIHVYRAANVDGSAPDGDAFSVLATRAIDADQTSTYYRDSTGDSSWWYCFTYYNAVSLEETSLGDSTPVRGDDFGHYASLSEIRSEAGFDGAVNLKDSIIDQQRRAAESEINGKLSSAYTVPFTAPVPAVVRTLTIKLAAAMLLVNQYGSSMEGRLKAVRQELQAYADRSGTITDDDGQSISSSDSVSGYPDENASRMFTVDMRF
ncbi:phage protein Gp36 family protein [Streptomyces iakyrus]|uniref:phage protein Gp36 family protein n=1 Tax=Streptomyces iakyrus TaxID=68219 RepID=UPI0036E0BE07